jgi:putative transposase
MMFAMGQAVPVRTNYTAGEVRRFAQRARDAAQARRLLAIASGAWGLAGTGGEDSGMDRQTLRDWLIRFNEQGADGLINIRSPGVPPKLNAMHKAFLARIVEEGPIPSGGRHAPSRSWASTASSALRIDLKITCDDRTFGLG